MFNRFALSSICLVLYEPISRNTQRDNHRWWIVLINLHYTRHNKATKVRVSPAPSVIITTSSVVTSLLPPHILTVTVTQGRMLTCSQNCNQWKTISPKTKKIPNWALFVCFLPNNTQKPTIIFSKSIDPESWPICGPFPLVSLLGNIFFVRYASDYMWAGDWHSQFTVINASLSGTTRVLS